MVSSLLVRGPEAWGTLEALLPSVDPGVLSTLAPSSVLALPSQGPISVGARVVPSRSTADLFRSVVHEVVAMGDGSSESGPAGTCSLRRVSDGALLKNEAGQAEWFAVTALALAGAPLEATPLHLALLLRCPWEVVSALVARAPEALSKLDALGRSPQSTASEVFPFPASLISLLQYLLALFFTQSRACLSCFVISLSLLLLKFYVISGERC